MADNVAVMRGAYEAFAKGDVAAVLALFDPNIEWNEAEHFTYWTGQSFRGPQAVVNEVLAPLGRDFDGFRIEVRRMVGAGDTVLVEARYRGTAKATGKTLDAQAHAITAVVIVELTMGQRKSCPSRNWNAAQHAAVPRVDRPSQIGRMPVRFLA